MGYPQLPPTTPSSCSSSCLSTLAQHLIVACRFLGSAGRDTTAEVFKAELLQHNVHPCIVQPAEDAGMQPSAVSVCLITPDGQRTMRTCMGAAATLSAEQLPMAPLQDCQLLHCEGYSLYKPDVLNAAVTAAKAGGAIVSLDLASFEVVRQCQAPLFQLLETGAVDIVFCNEDESAALADLSAARMASSAPHLPTLPSMRRALRPAV